MCFGVGDGKGGSLAIAAKEERPRQSSTRQRSGLANGALATRALYRPMFVCLHTLPPFQRMLRNMVSFVFFYSNTIYIESYMYSAAVITTK
jgi:hypothetical protein